MTLREHAEKLAREIVRGELWPDDVNICEQAITAAVEEEREQCAKLADKVRTDAKERDYAGAYVRGVAELVASRIRARSTTEVL